MFKTSIFGSLLLVILAIAMPAKAQGIDNNLVTQESYNLSPRELISLGRHGRFKDQGIPSHSNFGNGIRSGRITAKSLVESAISDKRLPENTLSDRVYLNAVNSHLKSGGCGSM